VKKYKDFSKSNKFLERAETVIPLGSQTFSKSYTQYPRGVSPLFATRARGAKLWDVDGYEYVDLVNSLAAITVGYKNKTVDRAVRQQLKKGVIFSLPGTLEFEVAEKICELVPSAEMVRFAKNGTDATSGAIRLARAYTGRNDIAICGYHGWQDWYIGTTTKNKGIPSAISNLSHTFEYNNIESLRRIFVDYPGQIAAVILEPMTLTFPKNNFLNEVKKLTRAHNSVLIFDEIVTGFRFSEGGAQEVFGVKPDLTTLGKGIANGYPLSAIVGCKEIMKEMTEVFFSGTFGGELISLAAANAVLNMHIAKKVVPKIIEHGSNIASITNEIIKSHNLSNTLELKGHDSWKILSWASTENYSSDQIRTLFLQEMFKHGVLVTGSHNVSTALTRSNIEIIWQAYDKTLETISNAILNNDLEKKLKTKPLVPLFKVR
jgi:glutamate-1-semialdehyde 2,1-aminomutase